MLNKSNEMVFKDPTPDDLINALVSGVAALKTVRKNPNRQIDDEIAGVAAMEVNDFPYGCRVISGGAVASSYPATTSAIVIAWHTRISGVKVVRVILAIAPVKDAAADITAACLGKPLAALGDKAGPLVVSSCLRELWEWMDIPQNDHADACRKACRESPENMTAWANLAMVLEIGSSDMNSKSPEMPGMLAEAIRQRVL